MDIVSYKNETHKLQTVYSVEHTENGSEKIKRFDDLGEAMTLYTVLLFREYGYAKDGGISIENVKLFEEIFVDGETIREKWIEPNNTFFHNLGFNKGK